VRSTRIYIRRRHHGIHATRTSRDLSPSAWRRKDQGCHVTEDNRRRAGCGVQTKAGRGGGEGPGYLGGTGRPATFAGVFWDRGHMAADLDRELFQYATERAPARFGARRSLLSGMWAG